MNDVRQKLADVRDLLTMVSHLSEKYSQGSNQEQIPWAGIKLTLNQASQIVDGVMHDMKDVSEQQMMPIAKFEGVNEGGYEQHFGGPQSGLQSGAGFSSSIAQRIKRMPASGGKIREVSTERQDNVAS